VIELSEDKLIRVRRRVLFLEEFCSFASPFFDADAGALQVEADEEVLFTKGMADDFVFVVVVVVADASTEGVGARGCTSNHESVVSSIFSSLRLTVTWPMKSLCESLSQSQMVISSPSRTAIFCSEFTAWIRGISKDSFQVGNRVFLMVLDELMKMARMTSSRGVSLRFHCLVGIARSGQRRGE